MLVTAWTSVIRPAGQYEREGFKFDVGSSMMFGLSDRSGGTNLITQALAAVGKRVETIPDPTQLEYHLPKSARFPEGLRIKVWCDYERFLEEMYRLFPESKDGIKGFYDECWRVRCLKYCHAWAENGPRT